MKPKIFFEKFDQLADAPNAVATLRELALELAVRGKLVAQVVTDEPASELLKRVAVEKVRRQARVELSDENQGATSKDETFEIPESWRWVGATSPAVTVSDQGKKIQTKDILSTGKYPVVDQGKVFVRGYCNDPNRVISVTKPIILFGDHTREVKLIDFDFVAGADGVKLLQPVCIDPRFYFLALRWLPLENRGYGRHFKLLKAARIPLPPLAEQKRIVEKMDELMALYDRLEAQQQERETRHTALARAALARFAEAPTQANLNFIFHKSYDIAPADLRKSILTLAVQGKLVPQDPLDEAAFKKDEPEIECAYPLNWLSGTVFELTALKSGSSFPIEFELSEGEYPYVKVSDMNLRENQQEITTSSRFVAPAPGDLKSIIPENSIIFPKRGGSIATNKKRLIRRALFVDSNIMAMTSPPFIDLQYLYIWFLGIDLWELNSGTSVPQVNNKDVGPLVIPVPPLAEQRRIVAKVGELMILVDQLETDVAASRATAANLVDAVVAELTARA